MPAFLAGGGAMGELIAALDWGATPLGPLAAWPACLRCAVSMMVRAPNAMILLWGSAGIMIYNDAYAVVAGQRHPAILGMDVAAGWPEVAAFNLDVLRTGLAGKPLTFAGQRMTLFRNGAAEDVWLDIGYSPVLGESGVPEGVLAIVTETTSRALADERLRVAQETGRFGTFEWFPQTRRVVVSHAYRGIFGLSANEDVTDQTLLDLIEPDDLKLTGNRRLGTQDNPLAYSEFRIRHKTTGERRWVARRGEILHGGADAAPRYVGVAWDITDKKTAELQDAFLANLAERLRDLSDASEITQVASEMLGRHVGAGRAGYAEIDASGQYMVIAQEWTNGAMPSLVGRHSLDAHGAPVATELRRGLTIRTDDVLTDPRLAAPGVADAFAHIGMRSGLTVPLIRDGRFAGLLYVHCAKPHVWSDQDAAVVENVAARTWDSVQRAQAERRVRDSEENFRLLAQTMPNQAWVANRGGRIIWVNEQALRYTGVAPESVTPSDWERLVHRDDIATAAQTWEAALKSGTSYDAEFRIRRAGGGYRWHIVRALPIRGANGEVTRWIGTNTDIDDQRRAMLLLEERVEERTRELRQAEEALRQSQKMEAIGQLTGGIAHDFNNLLTGIIGSLELMQRRMARHFPDGDSRIDDMGRFMSAANNSAHRAAALTHRLLAFARRQPLDTRPVDPVALMHGMAELLRRTLGEQVRLRIETPPDCWCALTDANQLESAVLNLAINARDAMSEGGQLTVAIANLALSPDASRAMVHLDPGDYVTIAVKDTGIGIPATAIERVFEPFFTTKPSGQGTGLGLSMVYGFARQSGGHVRIESQQGAGTAVTLYIPRAVASTAASVTAPRATPRGAGETVLVIEDVPAVRMLIIEVLREHGYTTIEAADATEALPILSSPRTIDLLVSDFGLPGLNGRQIAEYARERRPGLKVLFVTGYAEDAAMRTGTLSPGMAIITKPFAIEKLAAKVGEMIAEG
jgi:PAS domain S-box-containing protein